MQQHKPIQGYINNFRRRFSKYLGKGVGASILIIPSERGGAVLEIRLGANESNSDNYNPPAPTVNKALTKVQQTAFGGNVDGFSFGGTNIVMEPARIVLIKADASNDLWTDDAAKTDVQRIIESVVAPPRKESAQ